MNEVFRAVNICAPNGKGHHLYNLSFSLYQGEILALYGGRYAGRNSLFAVMQGTIEPTSGILIWDGDKEKKRPVILKLSGDSALIDELAIWENIAILWEHRKSMYPIESRKLKRMAQILLDDYGFELDLERTAKTLTPVEKLCIEILALKYRRAKILLIDGTDIEGTSSEFEKLKHLLVRMKQEGMAIIFFSHQMTLLSFLANRIAILVDGRIIKVINRIETSTDELLNIAATLYGEKQEPLKRNAAFTEEVFSIREFQAGLDQPISLTLHKGELVTLISPKLELYQLLKKRISEGQPAGNGELIYQGKRIPFIPDGKGVYMLNISSLDKLIEEMTPLENLCLGFYDRFSRMGFPKRDVIECVEKDFYRWYGHEGLLRRKDCQTLYRKDRIAINLYRLKMIKLNVIFCSDLSIHNDMVTYRMVRESLQEMADMGAAICIVTSDRTNAHDFTGRSIMLDSNY